MSGSTYQPSTYPTGRVQQPSTYGRSDASTKPHRPLSGRSATNTFHNRNDSDQRNVLIAKNALTSSACSFSRLLGQRELRIRTHSAKSAFVTTRIVGTMGRTPPDLSPGDFR